MTETGQLVGTIVYLCLAVFTVFFGWKYLIKESDFAAIRKADLGFLHCVLGAFYVGVAIFCVFLAWLCHTNQF